jgi:transposase
MSEVTTRQQAGRWSEAAREAKPASLLATPETERQPRLKFVNRNQLLLRTVDVDQLLERDHLVRAIWELTARLDLSSFTADVDSVEGVAGRPAFDLRLLISLCVCAYSEAVSSAREIERRCAYHPAYQWLTGCEVINHHTLSDFRIQHQEALDALFALVLGVLSTRTSDHLGTGDACWHENKRVRERRVVSPGENPPCASKGSAGAGTGDGGSARRGSQSAPSLCAGASGPREGENAGTSVERNGQGSSHREA